MIIAVYSSKGGVGKTTLAVNLAWASAAISKRRTLLWDLDPQGGASFILGQEAAGNAVRRAVVDNEDVLDLVRSSSCEGIKVLPADPSLRHLDREFHDLGKRKRLAKIASSLTSQFDRVIIDCPPGLTETSDQILRASDLVVIPVIPAVLSRRALDAVQQHTMQKKGPKTVLAPVFSMVDRRRALHRLAVDEHPDWPVIPMSSAFERVSQERTPIGQLAARSSAPVQAIAELWRRIEKALTLPG